MTTKVRVRTREDDDDEACARARDQERRTKREHRGYYHNPRRQNSCGCGGVYLWVFHEIESCSPDATLLIVSLDRRMSTDVMREVLELAI